MRKMSIILVATFLTTLNISCYGKLDNLVIENSKENTKVENENILSKTFNWGFGSTAFKLIHLVEIIFITEISRKNLTN